MSRVDQLRSVLPDAIAWARSASRRADEAELRLYSAAIAYRTIFSLIAFASTFAVVAFILGIDAQLIREDGRLAAGIGADIEEVAQDRAARTLELGESSAWLAGLIGFGVGLYTMSAGFAALCEALDRIHDTHVYRKMSRRYLRGMGVSLVFLLLALVTFVTLLITTEFGQYVFGLLGLDRINRAWEIMFRFVIPACAVLVTFGFVLRYGSHARPPWREVLPGAAVAGTAWWVLLSGFFAYIAFFDGFEAYGALASVIALLVFGYLQAWIVLLVALFRSEIAFVIALIPFVRQSGHDGASVTIDLHGGSDERPA